MRHIFFLRKVVVERQSLLVTARDANYRLAFLPLACLPVSYLWVSSAHCMVLAAAYRARENSARRRALQRASWGGGFA